MLRRRWLAATAESSRSLPSGRYAPGVVIVAGVDLAWSGRNPTGLCVLDAGEGAVHLLELDCRVLDAEGITSWLNGLGDTVLAAIDAPLIATAGRRAEAEMARVWGSRGVFAYSARPEFLESRGIAEGPRLGALLSASGWSLDPHGAGESPRTALEVFPHAIAVALLGAARTLRYKRGPIAARAIALEELRLLLAAAAQTVGLSGCVELENPVLEARGTSLKATEDRLDAMACALAGLHVLRFGLRDDEVFGDAGDGYIAVPRAL